MKNIPSNQFDKQISCIEQEIIGKDTEIKALKKVIDKINRDWINLRK